MKKITMFLALFALACSSSVYAIHGEASNITSLLGDGNGVFTGTLTHVSGNAADHPWYTFDASAGDSVTIQLDTPTYASYIWLFEVFDDNAEIGDANDVDYDLVAQTGGGASNTLVFSVSADGQYAIQLDSFLGGDGDYTLTVSGATGISEPFVPVPQNVPAMDFWSLFLMLGLISILGMAAVRRL